MGIAHLKNQDINSFKKNINIKYNSKIRILHIEKFMNILILLNNLLIYYLFSVKKIECQKRKLQFNSSSLTLKINGTGNMNILSNKYNFFNNNKPDQILINDTNQIQIKNEYNFSDSIYNSHSYLYNIKIIWNNDLNTTKGMFMGLLMSLKLIYLI